VNLRVIKTIGQEFAEKEGGMTGMLNFEF